MRSNQIRIEAVSTAYVDYLYRTPIKFGGTALDRATLLNVECTVTTGGGVVARGFGSMPLSNVWAFPSRTLGYDATLGAMKSLIDRVARITAGCKESGHPIDLTWAL